MPYLGCYKDASKRDLTDWLKDNTTPAECFKLARDKNYEFVGIQVGHQCWGSQRVGIYGNVPDSECKFDTKDKGLKGGSTFRNSVWFTGTQTFKKHSNYCVNAGGKDLK